MSLISRIFATDQKQEPAREESDQAVIVTMDLPYDEHEQEANIREIRKLTDALDKIIITKELGEYDGDEFGGGEATLYFYGENADAILAAIKPTLQKSSMKPFLVTLQYGDIRLGDIKESKVRVF